MDIVRPLVRVSILALFSLAAIVVMTVLFGAQMRFDRLAEIEIKGFDAPSTARIVTVGGSSAHAGEERAALATSVKVEPEDDSQFTSIRINRPGAAPSIHRVPKER